MALGMILGIAKMGMGIAGAMGSHANAQAEARARNEALMKQYKYQLQIRDKRYKDEQQIYATKLQQHDLRMKAADRAASRAYGVEQYKQSQRIKQAAFQGMALSRALAKGGGVAAAAGKTGRTAEAIDDNTFQQFARNQQMIATNLLSADTASSMRNLNIQDRQQSAINESFGQVGIAPVVPMMPLEPTQYTGPSSAGMMMGIGNSIIGGIGSVMGNMAPDPGNFGGGGFGGGGFGGGMPSVGLGTTGLNYSAPTPMTSGMNFGF